jgi:transcriptional antiterminator NusG
MEWFALYVKARHEFFTGHELQRKGVETFLPTVKKLRQWKDRKKLIHFPLFPGYLFVYISPDPERFLDVLKTKGSVTLISAESGRPTPVPPEEINSLKLLIDSGIKLDIYPCLNEGTWVRVRRGQIGRASCRESVYMPV